MSPRLSTKCQPALGPVCAAAVPAVPALTGLQWLHCRVRRYCSLLPTQGGTPAIQVLQSGTSSDLHFQYRIRRQKRMRLNDQVLYSQNRNRKAHQDSKLPIKDNEYIKTFSRRSKPRFLIGMEKRTGSKY